jgi:hypothetical protein
MSSFPQNLSIFEYNILSSFEVKIDVAKFLEGGSSDVADWYIFSE